MDASFRMESVTPNKFVYRYFQNRLLTDRFILDLNTIPLDKPRRLVVLRKQYGSEHEYSMSWRTFNKQTSIGQVALIPWTRFRHRIKGRKQKRFHVYKGN